MFDTVAFILSKKMRCCVNGKPFMKEWAKRDEMYNDERCAGNDRTEKEDSFSSSDYTYISNSF